MLQLLSNLPILQSQSFNESNLSRSGRNSILSHADEWVTATKVQLIYDLNRRPSHTTDQSNFMYEYKRDIENNQEAIKTLEATGESIQSLLEILHVKQSAKASSYATHVMKTRKISENLCSNGERGLTYSNFCILTDSFHQGHLNETQSRGLFAYLDKEDVGFISWDIIQKELLELDSKVGTPNGSNCITFTSLCNSKSDLHAAVVAAAAAAAVAAVSLDSDEVFE